MALKHYSMVALLAFSAFSTSIAWADDDVLEVHQQNDIFYVSGGIGDDEKAQLEAIQHNYNLRVMNADKAGQFSGDTRILISDLQHHPVLDATSGPIFYANLPKGRYIVESFAGEQSKKQTVRIAGEKTVYVRFMWPEDTAETNQY